MLHHCEPHTGTVMDMDMDTDTVLAVVVQVTGELPAGTGLCTKAMDRRVAPKIADYTSHPYEEAHE